MPKNIYLDRYVIKLRDQPEIALIIDDTADLDAIVYDVFAQAEHDELARTYVISEDAPSPPRFRITYCFKALPNVDRYDIVSKSIANRHYLIHTSNLMLA